MKAYNETLLKNEWVQKLAQDWTQKKLITQPQRENIDKVYSPLPYRPNWFIWIGLFIFTILGLSAATVIFLPIIDTQFAETFLGPIYGLGVLFFLNFLIKDRRLHFSGIDNAMLYAIVLSFAPLIMQIADLNYQAPWLLGLAYLPLLLFLIYYYGEPLITVGTFLTGLFIVASLAMEFVWGKLLLPFIAMLYAGAVWYFVHQFLKKEQSFYWKTALEWTHIAALSVFYAAGNYFVVREGNAALNDLPDPSPEVALAGIFWLLTFVIPLLYLYAAIHWKSLTFLVLGSIALLASLITLHYYYPFIPGDWATALLGLAGVVLVVWLMRYLKEIKNGFIYKPEADSELAILAGNIIATEIGQSATDSPQGPKFGGGDFGGGGSGEGY
ncbi:hypothetical protein [Persicitalea jodogahamensis]|uniref:Uncharacterized protein n=1 Tax=Persicitalea jodogahamensis TaxID=402147 RepID=A0A8J3D2I8_9BACT|nr:hypothetical protein [Persicitalea jodogahamensis]GHB60991.1 hypothetical protein GCM10007390_13420 [Persicitalea jodogahamensis]